MTDNRIINIDNKTFLLHLFLLLGITLCPTTFASPNISADLRLGFFDKERDERDGDESGSNEFRLRYRIGVDQSVGDHWVIKGRFAGRYSDENSDEHEVKFYQEIPSGDGLRLGDATIDELYARYQPNKQLRLTFGRMQTKLELDGVAKKSLDRNNSPNTDVTWTDGVYLLYENDNGWKHHGIAQYNYREGATEVRRGPLDFSDDDTRVSLFYGLENNKHWGPIVQRGFDISYLPDALCVDGTTSCNQRDDYIGLVTRAAAKWPMGQQGTHFMLAGSLGYAPNTQSNSTQLIGESGEVDGIAWQLTANFFDFVPKHSVGVVYGRIDAGWLLSPDFRNNNDLVEARYQWKFAKKQKLEARIRQRKELEQRVGSEHKQVDTDFYIRYTYKF